MELHHLRTFIAVAEEQNVTRAAKRLYMTPPAVSAHIKALEEELGIVLFVRLPTGMQLTEKGVLLKDKAVTILHATQDMVNQAARLQHDLVGQVSMGISASPELLRTVPLIMALREHCPGVMVTFNASVSSTILKHLKNHTVDLGFIFGDSPDPEVFSSPLTKVDLVIVAPCGWKTQIDQAEWKDIACLPWIYSSGYCPFQQLIDQQFSARGLRAAQIVQADDEAVKSSLVSAGLGLALLERTEAEHHAQSGKLVIWQHEPIQCQLSLAAARNRLNDPLVSTVLSHVYRVWEIPA